MSADAASPDAGTGVYIDLATLREWREDAEQRSNRADAHLVFAARIVRLITALEAPCGSCHPCNHWAAETWRRSGGPLPHKHVVDEWREKAAAYDDLDLTAHDAEVAAAALREAAADVLRGAPIGNETYSGQQVADYLEARARRADRGGAR